MNGFFSLVLIRTWNRFHSKQIMETFFETFPGWKICFFNNLIFHFWWINGFKFRSKFSEVKNIFLDWNGLSRADLVHLKGQSFSFSWLSIFRLFLRINAFHSMPVSNPLSTKATSIIIHNWLPSSNAFP
jgi:hypothetical protein